MGKFQKFLFGWPDGRIICRRGCYPVDMSVEFMDMANAVGYLQLLCNWCRQTKMVAFSNEIISYLEPYYYFKHVLNLFKILASFFFLFCQEFI